MGKKQPPGSSPNRPLHLDMDRMADPNADIPGLDDEQRDRMLSNARQGSRHDVFTSGAPVAMIREGGLAAGTIPLDPDAAAEALSGLETGIKLGSKSHSRVNGSGNGIKPNR
jgi:hypothetical protein